MRQVRDVVRLIVIYIQQLLYVKLYSMNIHPTVRISFINIVTNC